MIKDFSGARCKNRPCDMPEFLTPLRESRAKKVKEDLPQAILTNPGIRRDAASVSIALASFTPENGHKARRRGSLAVL